MALLQPRTLRYRLAGVIGSPNHSAAPEYHQSRVEVTTPGLSPDWLPLNSMPDNSLLAWTLFPAHLWLQGWWAWDGRRAYMKVAKTREPGLWKARSCHSDATTQGRRLSRRARVRSCPGRADPEGPSLRVQRRWAGQRGRGEGLPLRHADHPACICVETR